MSGWTPSPEDSGGSPGDRGTGDKADQGDGFGTQPGPRFGTGPRNAPQPTPTTQPGATPHTAFGTQDPYGTGYGTGYGTRYGPQPGSSYPGYRAQPDSTSPGYGPPGYEPQPGANSPGYGTRRGSSSPGYESQPGTNSPGYEPQPGANSPGNGPSGYGTQPGYGPQPSSSYPGYGTQPGYGSPGYAQPSQDGTYPAPPRPSRARMWFGILAGIIVLAVVIAGVSAYILNRSKKWVLTTPTAVAGLSRDTNSLDQTTFSAGVARFKSSVTKLPNYGTLKSTVSAIYALGSSQVVGFAGLNGTFNAQIVLKPGNGVKVTNVNPGPHGGAAECARTSTETICQWSTSTTIARLDIVPTSTGATPDSITTAAALMLKIRDAVEHPAHNT